MTFEQLKNATINHWTGNGLYKSATNYKQIEKLLEEVQEVRDAFIIERELEQKTEIGDCLTVIINLCQMNKFTPEECLHLAYVKNEKRDGKMLDGEFLHDKLIT
jgi:NTP pyrophosphatase (non-canonical NTP hydrolase)